MMCSSPIRLQITVNKDERSLTLSGERRRQQPEASSSSVSSDEQQEQQQRKPRQRFERRMGRFERTVPSLPDNADLTAVSAR